MISPEVLRRYPCFAGLSDQILKKLAVLAEERAVAAGQRIFGEGEPARFLYVINKGEVNIQYLLGNGELRTVDTLVDGDLLVWSALIEPYVTTAIGTATKETQLVGIAADKLRRLCEEDALLGYRLTSEVARLLAHRLESARVQLAAS